jgi:putative hydrolase of the HAD superfamily
MVRPRAVLFDIGGTLWSSPAEDPAGLAYCYGCGRDALLRELPDPPAVDALIEAVEGYFGEWEDIWRQDAGGRVVQPPTSEFVAEALKRIGLSPTAESLAAFTEAVLEASVHTARALEPEPGMNDALAALRQRGMRLGCVSNAFMTAETLQRIMTERGLGEHLELTVSSCEVGYRKPHPAIYEAALEAMGIAAAEAIFVGDRVDADVEGPAALGMRTVLTHQYRREDPSSGKVRPDHVISHLTELPVYIDTLLA